MDSVSLAYDSRSIRHKDPFGAVQVGTSVSFSVDAQGNSEGLDAHLEVSAPDGRHSIRMQAMPASGGTVELKAQFTPSQAGLCWYWFAVHANGRDLFLGAADADSGQARAVQHHPKPFQLTVYEKQAVPSWAGHGAFYHAFVDRFRKSGDCVPELSKGALLHADWDDRPFYIKGCKDGSITRWTFFGGNLDGAREKLPYLWEMGVNALYLSPIFESPSNHKYDTADYSKVDPSFGDEEALRRLCREAKDWGIRIVLDGVFSHTGSDSVYFNKKGRYPGIGAYQSKSSPYYSWYRFRNHPDDYESWWGFENLPNVNELDDSYISFMVESDQSIVRKWMRAGVGGWRLDVADELPDEFIKRLRRVIREENPESILIGEVWDDASNKVSYSVRREYLLGHELDSATGYPFRSAVLAYASGKTGAADFKRAFETLMENYPPEQLKCNLNILGSHDVARALTILGGAPEEGSLQTEAREAYELPPDALAAGRQRLMLAGLLQYLLPGTPMLYYGDEAGMQGYSDPFNRGPYPWGREDKTLQSWFKSLGEARGAHMALKDGDYRTLAAHGQAFAFARRHGEDVVLAAVNAGTSHARVDLDVSFACPDALLFQDLFFGPYAVSSSEGRLSLELNPMSSIALSATVPSEPLLPRLKLERSAGVLMHVSSLPSAYGIGDFGHEAFSFARLLSDGGQRLWQVLPMNPPSLGNSPYMCFSAMAGNELFISLDLLAEQGLLHASELLAVPPFDEGSVNFNAVSEYKQGLFRKAFARFRAMPEDPSYIAFKEKNSGWLEDYAMFMLIKGLHGGKPWYEWPDELRRRDASALSGLLSQHEEEISYRQFLQYIYDGQWKGLKSYANSLGISMVGDMAIYISGDSSDVWAAQEMFSLKPDGSPLLVSGVPPDNFSATGQLWGHPVYAWKKHSDDGFAWWKSRMDKSFADFDYTRIDHFRGFAGFYAVPQGNSTAEHGRWLEGPGRALFAAIADGRTDLPIIVEDLGVITPDVVALREALGFPGMKVLQFMDSVPSACESVDAHWVAYTGTHDNETLLQRYRTVNGLTQEERPPDSEEALFLEGMLTTLYSSAYRWAIAPLQDLLGLGAEARMNMPSVAEGNWGWRVRKDLLASSLSERMLAFAKASGRCCGE